ncbi:MAG: hypothetical protein ACPKOP_00315 [Sphaerochaetaceae bacterium]
MQIIEQYLQPKGKDTNSCEDGYTVTDDFIAVVDGATNKSGMKYKDENPGRVAMRLAIETIERLSPSCSALEAFNEINDTLHDFYQKEGILKTVTETPSNRCTASCVIYSNFHRQLWFLGDCTAMIDGNLIQFQKELDSVLANLRSLMINVELSQGATVNQLLDDDVARKYIVPLLNRQAFLQNSSYECEYTYYVLDGIYPIEQKHIQVVPVPSTTKEIVLSSDGYPQLFPTLKESEEYLQHILEVDPLCYSHFKSTKGMIRENSSYDDRAYIRFKL